MAIASPVFSVIMPVYNGARHVREAIASVMAQTLPSVELIAIDDGSNDDSASILAEAAMADARIRVESRENRGVAATRNQGLAMARGEYVTFLDQDDILPPYALERLYGAFKLTGADAVSGKALDFYTLDGARRFCEVPHAATEPVEVKSPVENTLSPERPGVTNVRASVWARGYRRAALSGLSFPDGVFGADDWIFTMRVMLHVGRHAALSDTVYLHRRHPDSVSSMLPMRYIIAMLDAVETIAHEWCDDARAVSREAFAKALSSHVQLWGMMLPALKRYSAEEERSLSQTLGRLRSQGLVPFVSRGHAMRYFLVRHGLKSLLPVFWPRRFKNMSKARNNRAEEIG